MLSSSGKDLQKPKWLVTVLQGSKYLFTSPPNWSLISNAEEHDLVPGALKTLSLRRRHCKTLQVFILRSMNRTFLISSTIQDCKMKAASISPDSAGPSSVRLVPTRTDPYLGPFSPDTGSARVGFRAVRGRDLAAFRRGAPPPAGAFAFP